MRKTRRKLLTIGLLLVLAGILVFEQGTQILVPVAQILGLTSSYETQTVLIPQTLISVPASNYTFLSEDLQENVQVRGAMYVASGMGIAFYIMTSGNFSEWRAGRPSAVVLFKPLAISYNFTFITNSADTYYFVFDNQDNSRRVVSFNLDMVETHVTLSPFIQYANYELLGIGVILSLLAGTGGEKMIKPKQAEIVPAVGWTCRFCGATSAAEQVFCAKCGRAKQ